MNAAEWSSKVNHWTGPQQLDGIMTQRIATPAVVWTHWFELHYFPFLSQTMKFVGKMWRWQPLMYCMRYFHCPMKPVMENMSLKHDYLDDRSTFPLGQNNYLSHNSQSIPIYKHNWDKSMAWQKNNPVTHKATITSWWHTPTKQSHLMIHVLAEAVLDLLE